MLLAMKGKRQPEGSITRVEQRLTCLWGWERLENTFCRLWRGGGKRKEPNGM